MTGEGQQLIGPHAEKRCSDTLTNALHVVRLATGEADEQHMDTAKQAGSRTGGGARAKAPTTVDRHQIAKHAATRRWGTHLDNQ